MTAVQSEDVVPTFADLGLPEAIVKTLDSNGVTAPFPIQAATIPDALAGRDILGRGRTGSGKTLSFGLPTLVQLAESPEPTRARRPRGLVLTPTRELAMQVADALDPYAKIMSLDMKVVCGGTSMSRQISALERGVDILVATPGRLRDLIDRKVCKLDSVAITVLDEADRMADMGFLPEVTEILDQVPAKGQRMLFSATLEEEIGTLVERYLTSPATHEVDPSASAVSTMTHHVLVVKPKSKVEITAAVAAAPGRSIAFVRTQMGADRVAEQLREAGIKAEPLHGGMTQQARSAVLERFKGDGIKALVATDVAARGIHVDEVDVVLNVDPARDGKDYLHRAGRTARAGRSGTVVTIALPHQRHSVTRMLEGISVEAQRHHMDGIFDAGLAHLLGARTLTELRAEKIAREAENAQNEADALIAKAERLTQQAARHNGEAARLRDRAERELSGEIPLAEPTRDSERTGRTKPHRGQGGGQRKHRDNNARSSRGHRKGDERGNSRGQQRRGKRDDRKQSSPRSQSRDRRG